MFYAQKRKPLLAFRQLLQMPDPKLLSGLIPFSIGKYAGFTL